jgi:hypothetical protein
MTQHTPNDSGKLRHHGVITIVSENPVTCEGVDKLFSYLWVVGALIYSGFSLNGRQVGGVVYCCSRKICYATEIVFGKKDSSPSKSSSFFFLFQQENYHLQLRKRTTL